MTETATMNTYEGMFLFPQIASSDLKSAQEHVEYLIGRGEGEIISLAKWDERRLAYEIKGNRRGLYFLTYFKATGEGAIEIERQVNLSEQLLRAMILKADLVPADVIAAADAREQPEVLDAGGLRAVARDAVRVSGARAGVGLEKKSLCLPRGCTPSLFISPALISLAPSALLFVMKKSNILV